MAGNLRESHSGLAPGELPLPYLDALLVPFQRCSEHAAQHQQACTTWKQAVATSQRSCPTLTSQGGRDIYTVSAGSYRKAEDRLPPHLPHLEHSLLLRPRHTGQDRQDRQVLGTLVSQSVACTGSGMSDMQTARVSFYCIRSHVGCTPALSRSVTCPGQCAHEVQGRSETS